MNVYLDIGNSRAKWMQADAERCWQTHHAPVTAGAKAITAHWETLPRPDRVIGVCVGDLALKLALSGWAEQYWGVPIEWVQSAAKQAGLTNQYSVSNLGADRWVAAIGARNRFPRGAVGVVDAGSAVTVDVVSPESVFLGGSILPGWRMMANALGGDTYGIGAHDLSIRSDEAFEFPRETLGAVQAGVMQAWTGGVLQAMSDARRNLQTPVHWCFTGGDGEALLARCRGAARDEQGEASYESDLVWLGLRIIGG